jgi:hypothetical protein
MTTAFAKGALGSYNTSLRHTQWACADCIERGYKSGARLALEDKSSLSGLQYILTT